MDAPAAALLAWLRCRWRIENVLKDLIHHYGMDWLCSYTADPIEDTRLIDNPARKTARATLATATNALATAERALAHLLGSPDLSVTEKNSSSCTTPCDMPEPYRRPSQIKLISYGEPHKKTPAGRADQSPLPEVCVR